MRSHIPIFYSAILLTLVNLLLRFVGTSFQVYLSGRIGAAGIGLLQLVMSVGGLAVVAGMAGIRTTTMYLTAEELGKNHPERITPVLSACLKYSFVISSTIGLLLYLLAPYISNFWIGDIRTLGAIRLFAAFLPTGCLCGVMTGYFTAANRIGMLSAVQVCEQLLSMAITIAALSVFGATDPAKACQCILLGNGLSGCTTLIFLILLRRKEDVYPWTTLAVGRKLVSTALPLASADLLKAGINTTENLMVPKRLAANKYIVDPLAAFGTVTGMVFPILMFPACILYGLAELLIPELARCSASGNKIRSKHLVRKSLRVSMIYGTFLSGLMFLLSTELCLKFYNSPDAAEQLKRYALLIPMLYCDAITDAMTKGLGQQKICVRYNILTSSLDVLLLYQLLPRYGMDGYFLSFLITHAINFGLSLRRLLRISEEQITLRTPVLTLLSMAVSIILCALVTSAAWRCVAYITMLTSLLVLSRILEPEDFRWLIDLHTGKHKKSSGLRYAGR